jgi:DNA repair protein RadC
MRKAAMRMKDWPPSERPRERLLLHGPAALSDAELLALLLPSGTVGASSVDCARAALQQLGGLGALFAAPSPVILAQPGWGRVGLTRVRAVRELSRRLLTEPVPAPPSFQSPETVRQFLCLSLGAHKYEVFMVLFLDTQHRLIASEEMFRGTLNQTSVYPREVVKQALAHNSGAVILAHNHPSGHPEPSQADQSLTRALQQALSLVDIRVLDHIIVAGSRSVSFAERGLM